MQGKNWAGHEAAQKWALHWYSPGRGFGHLFVDSTYYPGGASTCPEERGDESVHSLALHGPGGILAQAAICADKQTPGPGIASELPIEPGHDHCGGFAAIGLPVRAAMAHAFQVGQEHRHMIDATEVILRIPVRHVRFAPDHIQHWRVQRLQFRLAHIHLGDAGALAIIEQAALDTGAPLSTHPGAPRIVGYDKQGFPIVRQGWKTVDQIAAELKMRFPEPIDSGPSSIDIIREDRDSR